jgi:hypothetical protein
MSTKEDRKLRFDALMASVNINYKLGAAVYVETLNGKVLSTVVEINPSPFLVSCSVVFDLGNGTFCTLMFTK